MASRLRFIVPCLIAFTVVTSLAPVAAQSHGSQSGSWVMEDCHGLAALSLAPIDAVQATLPPGYEAQDAAAFLAGDTRDTLIVDEDDVPLDVEEVDLLPEDVFGLVGGEIWQCDRIQVGNADVRDASYGSSAAVIVPPEGAGSATMYFYKYGNFFDRQNLVTQSQRLGAPAEFASSVSVDRTSAGATGTVNLARGGAWTFDTVDVVDMDDGNFLEWHDGSRGLSFWAAAFTLEEGHQGAGSLTAPAGSEVAHAQGGASGEGIGIHAVGSFSGRITLTR